MRLTRRKILLIAAAFFYITGYGQIKVMTFNIRYDNPDDDENWWGNRKQELVQLIDYYNPEFLGIQERLMISVLI